MSQSTMRPGWMCSAALAAMATAGLTFGQQDPQHMQQMTAGDNGPAKQQVEDVAHKRNSEAMDSGGQMVQVPERALFMLSGTPVTYFHKAVEDMAQAPGKVREDIGMAASVFQLQAARSDGDVRQQMEACAADLFQLAEKVETRQVLGKEPLEKHFGRALHTLAVFEQQQAQRGLAAKDAERVGWGIRLANYDLIEALVYTRQQPSPQVSRALFDADTLGEQLIHLAKPTTGQLAARGSGDGKAQSAGDVQQSQGEAKRGTEPLNGTNQVAQAAAMPKEAGQVVEDLAKALQTTQQQTTNVKD